MHTIAIRNADHLRILGRQSNKCEALALEWTASGFSVRFQGTRLEVEVEGIFRDHAPWCAYDVDGMQAGRMMLCQRQWLPLVDHVSPATARVISFYKETQPMDGDPDSVVYVHALRMDGQLLPLDTPNLKIEFIGDSLTIGEGAIGPAACEEWLPMWMSARQSYPYFVAQALNAEHRVLALSGYGISWDSEHTLGRAMPLIYDRVCGVLHSPSAIARGAQDAYDFYWQPDVVLINLGTNDNGGVGKLPPDEQPSAKEKLETDALDFLQNVRRRNPRALILWAYGMYGDGLRSVIENAISRFSDERIHYIALLDTPREEFGARWHPSSTAHLNCARVIVAAIKCYLDGKE